MVTEKALIKEPKNNLRQVMDKRGWSIAETARRANITDKTVRKMINHEKTARNSKIKIAIALEVSAKEIFPNDQEL